MTFNTFKKIAAAYRPDVIVSKHGDFRPGNSTYTLGIVFIKDGKESKVYDYSGTYQAVLQKLGIPIVVMADVKTVEDSLKRHKELNGKPSLFSSGKPVDYTRQIQEEEEKLAYYYSDKVVRDWEW